MLTDKELLIAFWLGALLLATCGVISLAYAIQHSLHQCEWYQRRKGGCWVYDVMNEWRRVDQSIFMTVVTTQGYYPEYHRCFEKTEPRFKAMLTDIGIDPEDINKNG